MDKAIKKGAVVSYIAILFNIFSALLYTPFLIRALGSSDYAVYTLTFSIVNYFSIDIGIGTSLARFISELKYHKKEYSQEQLLAVVCKVFIFLSLLISILLACFFPMLGSIYKGLSAAEMEQIKSTYFWAAGTVIVSFLGKPLEGIFTANELFAEYKIIVLVQKIVLISLSMGALLFDSKLVLLFVAAFVTELLILVAKGYFLVYRNNFSIDISYWNFRLAKEILSFSLWISIISFAQRFITPFAPTILGVYSNSYEIALFSVAITLEGYVFTFASVLKGMFLPKVSEIINKHKSWTLLQKLQNRMGKIQMLITTAFIAAFCVFGKEFIAIWSGKQYVNAFYAALLLMTPNIVYTAQQISETALVVINEVKYRTFVYVLCAIFSVISCSLVAQNFGAIGVAFAISLSLWLFNIIGMTVVYKKVIQFDIKSFIKECCLSVLPPMIIFTVITSWINCFLPQGILWLMVKGLVWLISLGGVCFLFVLNDDEKNYVKKKFVRRK